MQFDACCSGKAAATEAEVGAASTQAEASAPKPQSMGHKNDLIVWLQLHPAQRHVYEVIAAPHLK